MGHYTPSYSGIGELLRSDFIEADMVGRAGKVMARAIATAPFDAKDKDGEHYVDGFHVESTSHGGFRGDRAEASVVNTNSAALFVEFGSKHNPKHRTLGKALDAAGDGGAANVGTKTVAATKAPATKHYEWRVGADGRRRLHVTEG